MTEKDKIMYMEHAMRLAEKGMGLVNPNPLVGAVLVKDGKIIGEGYHEKYGEPHAEVEAFLNAKEDVSGAEMFVTLEPCSHYGKTPPCVVKIIEKKIKKVYIGLLDPNPLVYMKGVKMLKNAGIEVEYGFLEDKLKQQNEIFLKYIQTKRPFIAIKYAMTLDGKIATYTNQSKWITNEKARQHVHVLRQKYAAILVGVGTILYDDAKLNVRLENKKRDPIRIIIDPALKIPLKSYVVQTAKEQPTWVVTTKQSDKLASLGVRIIQMDDIQLDVLLAQLGNEGVDSIFVEGGAFTHGSFLDARLIDKVYAYIAPKLIGGKEALTPVLGQGVKHLNEALELENIQYHSFDDNILIEGNVKGSK